LEHDPVIAICSQLPTSCCNNQTHAYISEEVLLPVTKGISRVVDSNSVLAVTRSLLQLACASPFGPVALILPQDISASTPTSSTPFSDEYRTRMDAEKTGREVSPSLSHALRRLNEAKRILLVVGAGVVRADVTEQVRSLAHKTGAYCTTTLQSKGSFYPLREITVSRHNLEALLCHIHYDLCLVCLLYTSRCV